MKRMITTGVVVAGLLTAGGASFAKTYHLTGAETVLCEESKEKKKCCKRGFLGLFGKKKCCKKEEKGACGKQAHQQESAPSTQDTEKQRIRQMDRNVKIQQIQTKPASAPTE